MIDLTADTLIDEKSEEFEEIFLKFQIYNDSSYTSIDIQTRQMTHNKENNDSSPTH